MHLASPWFTMIHCALESNPVVEGCGRRYPPKVDFTTSIWRVNVAKFNLSGIWIFGDFFYFFARTTERYLDCASTPSDKWSQDSRLIYGGRCTKVELPLGELVDFFVNFLENASGELLGTCP